ncbi:MAG TPA: inositol monophosphatase family protein [Solirubrobacteraceae bacterium]|nr:inositol monophosphatase family protein [Solirubrobacteraceae bacterium]
MSETASEQDLLTIAREAAAAAARILSAGQGAVHRVQAKSSPTDLVSETDVAAEQAIRGVLAERRPQDAILGEEGGATGDGALRWVIDPLDGTTNFLYGVPQYAVSVACEDTDGAIAGVVLDPVRGEEFTATRTGPAQLDGVDITGSDHDELATALVATGFAYESEVRARQAEVLTRVLPRVRDIRRAGAAALDLAWCACGRYDAYWERGVKPWDVAAGGLIAARAGLALAPLAQAPGDPAGLLAAAPRLRDELLALVLG